MPKFRVGQDVYASVHRYPEGESLPFAVVKGTIRAISARSCDVDLPRIGLRRLASSTLHAQVSVCIVRIGDFRTELQTLDPVCKSILQFLRLLLPDDEVRSVGLRTLGELEEFFEINASAYSLWIFVGHGTEAGELCFTRSTKVRASALATRLAPHASSPRRFLWLCCHAGRSSFAKSISRDRALCDALVAPIGKLHSAVASQFAQTILGYMFLEGRTFAVSFKKAVRQTPTATRFHFWQDGKRR